ERRIDARGRVAGWLAGQLGRVLERVDAAAARPVAAAVDGDLEEPRTERPAAAEAGRRAHHAEPGLLVEVLDVAAAGLPGEEAEQRLLPAPAELRERGAVADGHRGHERLVGLHAPVRPSLSRTRALRHDATARPADEALHDLARPGEEVLERRPVA